MALQWHERSFAELTVAELYAIVHLRERVFIVEQACIYQDADGLDPASRHLWAAADDGAIHAYLRILPAGLKYAEPSLGRVIVAPEARGTGLGRELMQRGLAVLGNVPVRIAAQAYLERFYGELGFVRIGDVYDEDGILHVDMRRD